MVEKVTAYKAFDGTRFDTEAQAAQHEVMTLLGSAMEKHQVDGFTIGMVHAILDNADTILPALKNFVEAKGRELPPVAGPSEVEILSGGE